MEQSRIRIAKEQNTNSKGVEKSSRKLNKISKRRNYLEFITMIWRKNTLTDRQVNFIYHYSYIALYIYIYIFTHCPICICIYIYIYIQIPPHTILIRKGFSIPIIIQIAHSGISSKRSPQFNEGKVQIEIAFWLIHFSRINIFLY